MRLAGFPTGFIDLIGSQNFGSAPKEIADVIVPSLELLEMYLVTKQVGVVQVLAAPANGNNNGGGLRVPAGEVWRVQLGGVFVSQGAGVQGEYTPIAIVSGITVPLGETITPPAATTRMLPCVQTPFWMKAGDELSVFIAALAGAPTVSIAYVASRFRA